MPAGEVGLRHLWGQTKPAELTATAEAEPGALYAGIEPVLSRGLPFVRTAVSDEWFNWPSLPDLFPVSFPDVNTSRDGFLVDVDINRLRARVADYFDTALSHEEIARRYPGAMKTTAQFDAHAVRDALLARGGPDEAGFVRFAYRPFDIRWLYWEADSGLLDRPRHDYRPHVFDGNVWLVLQNKARPDLSPPTCAFRGKAAIDSDLIRPPIPRQNSQSGWSCAPPTDQSPAPTNSLSSSARHRPLPDAPSPPVRARVSCACRYSSRPSKAGTRTATCAATPYPLFHATPIHRTGLQFKRGRYTCRRGAGEEQAGCEAAGRAHTARSEVDGGNSR